MEGRDVLMAYKCTTIYSYDFFLYYGGLVWRYLWHINVQMFIVMTFFSLWWSRTLLEWWSHLS